LFYFILFYLFIYLFIYFSISIDRCIITEENIDEYSNREDVQKLRNLEQRLTGSSNNV